MNDSAILTWPLFVTSSLLCCCSPSTLQLARSHQHAGASVLLQLLQLQCRSSRCRRHQAARRRPQTCASYMQPLKYSQGISSSSPFGSSFKAPSSTSSSSPCVSPFLTICIFKCTNFFLFITQGTIINIIIVTMCFSLLPSSSVPTLTSGWRSHFRCLRLCVVVIGSRGIFIPSEIFPRMFLVRLLRPHCVPPRCTGAEVSLSPVFPPT